MTDTLDRTAAAPIVTDADRAFFDEHGYVAIPNAVPQENLDAVVAAIWNFLGMDPNDPNDWYREPHRTGSMVEMYHHAAMWANRQHPRLYQIFREVHGTGRLAVSLDRVSMKPPPHADHPEYDHAGFIHWDMRLDEPRDGPLRVQGVLVLTDTDAAMGGFQCVPGSHQRMDEIAARMTPEEQERRRPDVDPAEVVPVVGKAGDLVIWNRMLLHGNGRNRSHRPRLAQYISMNPIREPANEARRQDRIRRWQERIPPASPAFPGDPRGWEAAHYGPAELTPLGRCLLGVDPWPAESSSGRSGL